MADEEEKMDDSEDWGLEDLEDFGAFTDEGIMEGCYSDAFDELGADFFRNMTEYEIMHQFFGRMISFARMSLGLTEKEMADAMDMPQYIVTNLEAGKDNLACNYEEYPDGYVLPMAYPAGPEDAQKMATVKIEWWQGKGNREIEEKILEFLLEYKKNNMI